MPLLTATVSSLDGEGLLTEPLEASVRDLGDQWKEAPIPMAKVSSLDGEGLLTEPLEASVRDLSDRSKEARVPNKLSDRKDENTV